MRSRVLQLPHMFAPDEPLVASVVEQMAHLGRMPSLSKTRHLTHAQVSTALDVAFWASLGANEGRPTRARLLFAEPELLHDPVRFASLVAYEPSEITKLAPAVPEGGCIGVCADDAGMHVWGMCPSDPGSSLHALGLWIPLPGVVHVRIGALRPYAVVSDGRASILADAALALPEQIRLRLGKELTGGDIRKAQAEWRDCLVLAALARRVLHRGHGGTLLLVPDAEGAWVESVEIAHRFAVPDASLRLAVARSLAREDVGAPTESSITTAAMPEARRWQVIGPVSAHHVADEAAALRRVAPYASVDGAVVVTRDLDVLGFGAKIHTPHAVGPVLVTGPQDEPTRADMRPMEDTGGTRHQSAARFVAAHHGCVAVVVSHDRHISLFFWEESLASVRMIRNVDWWD